MEMTVALKLELKHIKSADERRKELLQWRRDVKIWVKGEPTDHLYLVWHGTENAIGDMIEDLKKILHKDDKIMFTHAIKKIKITIALVKKELWERGISERVC